MSWGYLSQLVSLKLAKFLFSLLWQKTLQIKSPEGGKVHLGAVVQGVESITAKKTYGGGSDLQLRGQGPAHSQVNQDTEINWWMLLLIRLFWSLPQFYSAWELMWHMLVFFPQFSLSGNILTDRPREVCHLDASKSSQVDDNDLQESSVHKYFYYLFLRL